MGTTATIWLRESVKVVHFVSFAGQGGAGRAALRLHRQLLKSGWNSRMNSLEVSSLPASENITVTSPKIFPRFSRLLEKIFSIGVPRYEGNNWSSGMFGWISIRQLRSSIQADVIILYWVGAGFLSLLTIGILMRLGKPVVWRLSDMWPFTGGCHYSRGCSRFQSQCGRCPYIKSRFIIDRSLIVMILKNLLWKSDRLTVICPSHWMANKVLTSSLFSSAKIEVVPTGVDTNVFAPIGDMPAADKSVLDSAVLQSDFKLLFVADGGLSSERKGGHLIREIHAYLQKSLPNLLISIIVIGGDNKFVDGGIFSLGRIASDASLASWYRTCSVLICPFDEDNLPNVILESMACGTPPVVFNQGGACEAVVHGQTGLLVNEHTAIGMARSVQSLLEDPLLLAKLTKGCRRHAVDHFELSQRAVEFQNLLKGCSA